MSDPLSSPEVVDLKQEIAVINDKIRVLQKQKSDVTRKLRSVLSKLITKHLANEKKD